MVVASSIALRRESFGCRGMPDASASAADCSGDRPPPISRTLPTSPSVFARRLAAEMMTAHPVLNVPSAGEHGDDGDPTPRFSSSSPPAATPRKSSFSDPDANFLLCRGATSRSADTRIGSDRRETYRRKGRLARIRRVEQTN